MKYFWKKDWFKSSSVHLALITAQIMWASMAVYGKTGLYYIHPVLFIFFRLLGSAIIFHFLSIIFYRKHYFKIPSKKEILSIVILSFFGVVIFCGFYIIGLKMSSATNAVIFELTSTVWASIGCILLKREKKSILKILGCLVAFGGGLIMSEIDKFQFHGEMFFGNILLLIGSVSFAFYLVYGELVFKGDIPAIVINSWLNTFSALVYLIVNLIWFSDDWSLMTLKQIPIFAWFSVVYSIIVGSVLAYQLMSWALKHTTALVASIYFPFQSLSGILFAFFFLGENLTIHVVIGGIMVIYSKKMEQKKIDYEKLDNKEKITINNENEEEMTLLNENKESEIKIDILNNANANENENKNENNEKIIFIPTLPTLSIYNKNENLPNEIENKKEISLEEDHKYSIDGELKNLFSEEYIFPTNCNLSSNNHSHSFSSIPILVSH
jgi:drug/metabolite transporter (DMT)-like permease